MVSELTSLCLFGCALDSDEREVSIKRKIEYAINTKENSNLKLYYDPYDALTRMIEFIDIKDLHLPKGKVEVESWLTPFPYYSDLAQLSVQCFVDFIDSNGCLEYANKIYNFTREILPNIPFLIGVDHSLSGGVLKALSEERGVENVSAIFLDSHFDGIPSSVRCEMIHYDIENNSESIFSVNDPFIYGRSDSYNTESFIKFLINEKTILPENTFCIGISNYPSQKAFEINDPRVKRYIEQFTNMQHRGLTIMQKEALRDNPENLKFIFEKHTTPYFYISIDMDIGANSTYNGVRFKDHTGLSLKEIQNVIQLINKYALKKNTLAGMDLMEIDMHSADEKTFTSALIIIKELLASKS